jgi:hypothetical protein
MSEEKKELCPVTDSQAEEIELVVAEWMAALGALFSKSGVADVIKEYVANGRGLTYYPSLRGISCAEKSCPYVLVQSYSCRVVVLRKEPLDFEVEIVEGTDALGTPKWKSLSSCLSLCADGTHSLGTVNVWVTCMHALVVQLVNELLGNKKENREELGET